MLTGLITDDRRDRDVYMCRWGADGGCCGQSEAKHLCRTGPQGFCPSVWGGLTILHSPDVREASSGKLRSSSATQEKLQYPFGRPAAVLPTSGSPVQTESICHKSLRCSKKTEISWKCPGIHFIMIAPRCVYLDWLFSNDLASMLRSYLFGSPTHSLLH